MEVSGDVHDSLPSESSGQPSMDTDGDASARRVYYMVHPSVDMEGSSSVP